MTWPTFLTPGLAGIAAAIAVPTLVLLYFLKLRRRSMDVSTTLLWKRAVQDLQANAPFQKLRKNILLFVQLVAILLLLLAIAQPMLDRGGAPPPRSVIVIDRSASMSALDAQDDDGGTITRLERAKLEALAFVDSMGEGGGFGGLWGSATADEAMVVTFDAGSAVVQPFTSSKSLLRSAIESITPASSTTLLEPAARAVEPFAAARTIVGEGDSASTTPGAPVLLWSDGGLADAATAELPSGITIDYRRVGSGSATNIAITSMQAQRTYDAPDEIAVFVAVQSTDSEPRDIDVEFGVDGIASRVRTVKVPARSEEGAPGVAGVVFRIERATAAVLSARLLLPEGIEDALPEDNRAWAALSPARRLTVALVGDVDIFTRNALESMPLSRIESLSVAEFEASIEDGAASDYEVYVIAEWPTRAPDADAIRGRFLSMGALLPGGGIRVVEPAQERVAAFVNADSEHPALRYINLDPVRLVGVPGLEATEGAEILANTTEGPAIFEIDRAGTRAIVLGFDVTASTWPAEWSFPLFLAQAVRYLGDDLSEVAAPTVRPGEVVRTPIPSGVTAVRVRTPSDEIESLEPGPDGTLVIGPVEETGIYTLSWEGPPGPQDTIAGGRAVRLLASSMLDGVESRLESAERIDLSRASVVASRSSADPLEARSPIWPYFVVLALVVVLLEWYLYNRKVRL